MTLRIVVFLLNDTALEKMTTEVVNILQGMPAAEDMDLAYSLSAVYFDNNGLRRTTKSYRNPIVHPVSMQVQGSIFVASIIFLVEEY